MTGAHPEAFAASPQGQLSAEAAAIEAAFCGAATIGAPAAARLLGMDIKTLQRHVAAGTLSCRIKSLPGRSGGKSKKPRCHRVFSRGDITGFLSAIVEETSCPSTAPGAAPISPSISRSRVIDFPARPGSRTNVTLRGSRKPKR
jgi:hypothetical protein